LTQSAKDRVLANITESQAARNASNMGNGLNYNSLPISNKNATQLLENRSLGRLPAAEAREDALGVVNSFKGQIYMRRGQAGEMFESFSDIDSNSPASLVFVTKGLKNITNSLDRQIILALPDSELARNSAIRYRPAVLKVDQILLEGEVAGQKGGIFGSTYKAGGGHQTVTDGGRFSGKVGFGD
jgi:hypothetical protein